MGHYLDLTDTEIKVLRNMPEFKAAMKDHEKAEKKAAKKREAAREARRNPEGTWKHQDPNANPLREDGLYGKAAQAADGDWYSSH